MPLKFSRTGLGSGICPASASYGRKLVTA